MDMTTGTEIPNSTLLEVDDTLVDQIPGTEFQTKWKYYLAG